MNVGRVLLVAGGAIGAIVAAGIVAAGGVSLWADSAKTDRDGYFTSGPHPVQTTSHALVSDGINIDSSADWLFDDGHVGVRVAASPSDGERVFICVARQADVSAYLSGVRYDRITDLDVDPFSLDTQRHDGDGTPVAPGSLRIWKASTEGSDSKVLTWNPEPGNWSVVIMNADGSAGVDTQTTFGARASFLFELGLGLVLGGAALLVGSLAMLIAGARRRPTSPPGVPAAGLAVSRS
jgi:hypothetical protein